MQIKRLCRRVLSVFLIAVMSVNIAALGLLVVAAPTVVYAEESFEKTTLRFSIETGRLVWFDTSLAPEECKGEVMPLVGAPDTPIAELGGGSYHWDAPTRILTLSNIRFTTPGDMAFIVSPYENMGDDSNTPGITISLTGTNEFITTNPMTTGCGMHTEIPLTIIGQGSLKLGSAGGFGILPANFHDFPGTGVSVTLSSGTLEVYGGEGATHPQAGTSGILVAASAYTFWTNNQTTPPETGGLTFPDDMTPYAHTLAYKYVKIAADSNQQDSNTVRFATTTGRLVWFTGGIPASEGEVMPLIAAQDTPMPELGGGTYHWDSGTRTLTLSNVNFTTDDVQAFIISPYENMNDDPSDPTEGIILKLIGSNSFIVDSAKHMSGVALHSELDITVTGGGSLTIGCDKGTGLVPDIGLGGSMLPRQFTVSDGTVEIYGDEKAVDLASGGFFGSSAAAYTYWTNTAAAANPGTIGTAYPGTAYSHSNSDKYVKIATTAPQTSYAKDTLRFSTATGRLVWFDTSVAPMECKGEIMPLAAAPDTAITELGGGSYHWDSGTRTLTLTNMKFNTTGDMAFIISPNENMSDDENTPGITLKLVGANAFTTTNVQTTSVALHAEIPLTITGTGSLRLNGGGGTGILPVNFREAFSDVQTVTVKSGTVEIFGPMGAAYTGVGARDFVVDAPNYTYWVNNTAENPGGGGVAVPGGSPYSHSLTFRYVKIVTKTAASAAVYAVTLNANGGVFPTLTHYTQGVGATLPTGAKPGYTFAGWYAASDFSGAAVTAISAADSGDKEYWAKWTADYIPDANVSVDGNVTSGGAVNVNSQTNTAEVVVRQDVITEGIASAVGNVKVSVPAPSGTAVSKVTLTVQNVTDLSAKAVTLTIETAIATLTFDSAAEKALANEGRAADPVVVSVTRVNKASLSPAIQNAIADNAIIVDFTVTVGGRTVSDFGGGAVAVSIPYTLPAGVKDTQVVVYYLNDRGVLELLTGVYNPVTKTVDMTLRHFSKYVVKVNDVKYNVGAGWYNSESLDFAVQRGLVGVVDGSVDPTAATSRADFVVSSLKALGIQPMTRFTVDQFSDVGSLSAEYQAYLRTAKELGIISGVGGNRLDPDSAALMEHFFQIVNNIYTLGLVPAPAEVSRKTVQDFTDGGELPEWAAAAANSLIKRGIIQSSGKSLKVGAAFNNATTAEMLSSLGGIIPSLPAVAYQ